MVKVSIIVPVYNVANYIAACLDSLVGQSLQEIEIICIDDASEDNSREILLEYHRKDNRVKTLLLPENRGTLYARTAGVKEAAGQYLMFVDSDDFLETSACQQLYLLMEEKKVDVIHFNTCLHPGVGVSDEMTDWTQHFLTPHEGTLCGPNLLELCFVQEKFDFNITNKIWKREICVEAFSKVQTQRLVASEDRYLFFLMMYYTKSYLGIGTKLYHYNLGVGVTGGDTLNLEQFEKRCSGAGASRLVSDFLEGEHVKAQYQEILKVFADKILWDCVYCWYDKLPECCSAQGFEILRKYFNADALVSAAARLRFDHAQDTVKRAGLTNGRKIAIYCRYLGSVSHDSTDSQLRSLVDTLHSYGCSVMIYTDRNRKGSSFSMETCHAKVIYLPDSIYANWHKYEERAREFYTSLKENGIDILLYASPESHIASYDMLLATISGITVIPVNNAQSQEMPGITKKYHSLGTEELGSPVIMFWCFIRACIHKIFGRG